MDHSKGKLPNKLQTVNTSSTLRISREGKTELTEENCDPDTDFLRPKVLEENVVNEGQADSLSRGEEDGGERSEDVVDFETRCES